MEGHARAALFHLALVLVVIPGLWHRHQQFTKNPVAVMKYNTNSELGEITTYLPRIITAIKGIQSSKV